MNAPHRRRWRWWWLLPLLLLGLPGLLALWLLDPATVESLLRQAIRENLALELRTEEPVELVVFPAPRLRLQRIELIDSQQQGLARVGAIDVELPWNSLWQRPPSLGRIALRDIDIRSGTALDQWLAQWQTGPASPSLSWPRLERGLSLRRLRYLAPAQPGEDAEEPTPTADDLPASAADTPSTASGDSVPSESGAVFSDAADDAALQPLFELAHLELEPLLSGGPLQLDLSLIAAGYRLGLQLEGRAEDQTGSLRVAAASLQLAFGPAAGEDEALRGEGEIDLAWLPAGGLRGELSLSLPDPAWLVSQSGLQLSGPWQIEARFDGEEPWQSVITATLSGPGVDGRASWPLDGSAQPLLELDLLTEDGLRIEGLRLQREAPVEAQTGSATDAESEVGSASDGR